MGAELARLTSPSGAPVTVEAGKVDGLLSRGFTRELAEPVKAPAKKAAKKAVKKSSK